MEVLKFEGPYVCGEKGSRLNRDITATEGVYLWCIRCDNGVYRVYYVGESLNLRARLLAERLEFYDALWSVYDIERLKSNDKKLVYCPGKDVEPDYALRGTKYEHSLDLKNALSIFVAPAKTPGTGLSMKEHLERIEAALVIHLINCGKNILHVSKINPVNVGLDELSIRSNDKKIENLTDLTIRF